MMRYGLVGLVVLLVSVINSHVESVEVDGQTLLNSISSYDIVYARSAPKGGAFNTILIPSDGVSVAVHKANATLRIGDVFGSHYTLDLVLDDSITTSDFRNVQFDEAGDLSLAPPLEKCIYKGEVKRERGTTATISTCNNAVYGYWTLFNETFFILPVPSEVTGRIPRRSKASLVYRASDIIPGTLLAEGGTCGFSEEENDPHIKEFEELRVRSFHEEEQTSEQEHFNFARFSPPPAPANYYVDILVVHDGSTTCDALAQIVSAAQARYQTQFQSVYTFAITTCVMVTGGFSPSSAAAQDILSAFSAWLKTQSYRYDTAFFFTTRDFTGTTIGLANLGVVCLGGGSSSGIVQLSTNMATSVATFAHELGHNFNMQHDDPTTNGCSGTAYIMGPSVSNPPATQFSTCSVSYINTYAGNPCSVGCLPSAPLAACQTLDAQCANAPISSFSGGPFTPCAGDTGTSCNVRCQNAAGTCYGTFNFNNQPVCRPNCRFDSTSASCVAATSPQPTPSTSRSASITATKSATRSAAITPSASTSKSLTASSSRSPASASKSGAPVSPSSTPTRSTSRVPPSASPSSTRTKSPAVTPSNSPSSVNQQVASYCQQLFSDPTASFCPGTNPSAVCQLMCAFTGDTNCYFITASGSTVRYCRPNCTQDSAGNCSCPGSTCTNQAA